MVSSLISCSESICGVQRLPQYQQNRNAPFDLRDRIIVDNDFQAFQAIEGFPHIVLAGMRAGYRKAYKLTSKSV